MKLLTIRLHPFGGTANRTSTLHGGINVLEGPNEFGKSTLSNALWHALFTPTNLTPANLLKTMGRWYPKPGGDHARVTLQFEADGQLWTLQKAWGAGAASSLQADGAAGIADPPKVQDQLNRLLRRNEATWRHVLFTGQAQLAATVDQLRASSGKLDEVQTLLAGPAAIPGDIPPEKLAAALKDRVTQHFGRWNLGTHGPEGGRGIDKPWEKQVGQLLESFYAMENVRRKLDDVIRHEKTVDDVNAKIHRLDGELAVDEDFVRNGRGLRDGLGKRAGLQEKGQRLTGELGHLREIMIAWPGADLVMQAKETERVGVARDLDSLEDELKNARKRGQAEQLRVAHGLLVTARANWKTAAEHLAKSKVVDPGLLTELKRLEKEIDKLRIHIAAQKLTARLESTAAISVKVQRGTEESEVLTLSPSNAWENQADGIFRMEFQDLKLSVESGTGDVIALFTDLESARQRHAEILKSLGHESLAAAQMADGAHHVCLGEESTQKGLYRAALQGRTEDEWSAVMDALTNIPATRSIDVLEGEKTRLLGRKAALDLEIRQEREKIDKWTREHLDLNELTDKILAKSADLKHANQDLAGLPDLPVGFSSIPEYLDQLRTKEEAREQRDQRLRELKIEQALLTGAAPNHTAEELRADLEVRQRDFDRQQATGQALLRIQAKLLAVTADQGAVNPMLGLATAVSSHFRELTCGRYDAVTLDGVTPVKIGGALTLDTPLLSQGTLGSLALATRLALSELYLNDMGGFFLLDDPFTDMDASRRAAAIHALASFSENHQVLFFTCHPDHARELKNVPNATTLQWTE
ncbi:MAG: hypothetical protein RLZZ282_886 [Verrucomicrobiota bacterium]